MVASAFRFRRQLRDSIEEIEAVACEDRAGHLHWVRIFRPVIAHRGASFEPKTETPDGLPAIPLQKGRFLLFSEPLSDWVEAKPVGAELAVG